MKTTQAPTHFHGIWLALIAAVTTAGGAEYFVAPGGADGNDGLTVSTAWRTINKALATVPEGTAGTPTIIRVAAGDYAGETDGTYWKLNFRGKDHVHLIGASAAQTVLTRGAVPREMSSATGVLDLDQCVGARVEGLRIVLDSYPTMWNANVIRINNPDGVVIRDVWIQGLQTPPADRSGRQMAIAGTAGSGGLRVEHCCFSGGGMAFWLGVNGASCTIEISHVTITDYATTRMDDYCGFFDQRLGSEATPVRVRNSIFNKLHLGINAASPTNRYGFLYHVESNSYYNLTQGLVNQHVWYTNANELLAPDFFTMADGRGYVTRNTSNGWFYHAGMTGAPPQITYPHGDMLVTGGSVLAFTVQATDPDTPPQALVYSAGNLPPGASFNPTNQQFVWHTSAADTGVYPSVAFSVNDGESAGSVAVTIYVLGGPVTRYYVRTNGMDSAARSGLSPAEAWRTITYALTRAQGGNKYEHNVLDVGPGEYAAERSGLHGRTNNWHINIAGLKSLDIIGAGPHLTRIIQGSNDIWALDAIVTINNASHLRLSGLHIPVDVSSDQFDHACIRIHSCDGIVLDNLWLSGPRGLEMRNGHGIYVSGSTGADGIHVSHVLIEGFGQGFYTTAQGGWSHSNILRYCTMAEQDGSIDYDDGLGLWHRVGTGAAGNHVRAERCIFANLPANRATFGVGMRVDSSLNLNDEGNVIIYSFENNYYNCGADGMSWYQPNLAELEDNSATNDVTIDPQFFINNDGLPYCSELDYGWQPVPEAGWCGLLALLALAARRAARFPSIQKHVN